MAKRLTVDLPDDVAAKLEAIAERHSITISEAVRRAIGTEVFFTREVDSGKRVLIAPPTDCPWCASATAQMRAATGNPKTTAPCTLHRPGMI